MNSEAEGFQYSVLQKINGFLYRCKTDEHYTMLAMTSGIERIFGYKVADLVGNRVRTYSSIIHPDDVAKVDMVVNRSFELKQNFDVDYRIVCANGEALWVHETGGGVWDDEGTLLYCEGAVTDINTLYLHHEDRVKDLARIASRTTDVLESLRYLKLLALNAGIEAARAGDAGASFGVLAQEMRKLAYQSEEMAKSIAA